MTTPDVDGNDNQPEWGYCTYPGCTRAALPIWLSGEYPDDADLYFCEQHIGTKIKNLMALVFIAFERHVQLGADWYERARRELGHAD